MDFKKQIQSLTAEQIRELNKDDAQRVISKNVNTLGELEKVLFDEIGELGKHRVAVEQLKSYKSMVVEQNRALGVVVKNG